MLTPTDMEANSCAHYQTKYSAIAVRYFFYWQVRLLQSCLTAPSSIIAVGSQIVRRRISQIIFADTAFLYDFFNMLPIIGIVGLLHHFNARFFGEFFQQYLVAYIQTNYTKSLAPQPMPTR